jgi:hypothetical protein
MASLMDTLANARGTVEIGANGERIIYKHADDRQILVKVEEEELEQGFSPFDLLMLTDTEYGDGLLAEDIASSQSAMGIYKEVDNEIVCAEILWNNVSFFEEDGDFVTDASNCLEFQAGDKVGFFIVSEGPDPSVTFFKPVVLRAATAEAIHRLCAAQVRFH